MSSGYTIIYTREAMYLSKKSYPNWRAVQDDYETYMASLADFDKAGLLEYLGLDYPADQGWPNWEALVTELDQPETADTLKVPEPAR